MLLSPKENEKNKVLWWNNRSGFVIRKESVSTLKVSENQLRFRLMISIFRIVCLLLFLPSIASAALIRSTAGGGNWSNTATWEKGIVPVEGDVAELVGPVTVDVNITVGTSAHSGDLNAIQLMTSGSLKIVSGVTLTSRGNIQVSNTVVTLDAGATLEFDGSVSGTQYEFDLAQAGARLQINGTSTAHCKIFANANGPNAYITDGGSKGSIFATYCDFLRMGSSDPVLPSLWWEPVDDTEIRLYHCTFATCSVLYIGYPSAKSIVDIQFCIWTNSIWDRCVKIDAITAKTHGLRKFFRCWFDINFALGA